MTSIVFDGIFETHLHVADLERSAAFYEQTLGLQLGHTDPRGARFYWIGDRGGAMLGIWQKPAAQIVRQHFAFRTTPDRLTAIIQVLKERGVQVSNFLDDGTEAPTVFGWMPAVSIYFKDPDGHSLEFIAMLPDEPKPELGVVRLEDWEDRVGRNVLKP